MDLERIKQNFRIRSGRNKPKKKVPKKTDLHSVPQGLPHPPPSLPNGDITEGEHLIQEHTDQEQDTDEPNVPISQGPEEQEQTQDTVTANEDTPAEEQVDLSLDSTTEEGLGALQTASDTANTNQQEIGPDELDQTEPFQKMPEPNVSAASPGSEADDFDLNPPTPRPRPPSIESVAELLFSSGHLNALLHNSPQLTRFSTFLQKYIPDSIPLLSQYLETQKAIKAVEYANAVADGLKPEDTGDGAPTEVRKSAATLDPEFEAVCNAAFNALVGIALPQYVTYQLIKVCSECLTNEITGRQSNAIVRDLVGGLSEVFCLTDPHQEDNPIIYASEEFYRLTGYGEEDVIGHNCRFLQGRKTNLESPRRIKEAVEKGEEIYETLLNYRRDGRPFINVLMIAPLHDNSGEIKYHIGAQVDVSGLVEGGKALPGFQRFLNRRNEDQKRDQREKARRNVNNEQKRRSRALARLRDLSEMFDLEESAVVRETSRANSLTREDDENRSIASADRQKTPRRVLQDSDFSDDEEATKEDEEDNESWKLGESGNGNLSGKLPGIYDSFMLFRPYPSLRIVFISPKLRKFSNVLQRPMLSHIAAPGGIINGISESLKNGVPVSAKVHFMPERGVNREGTKLKKGTRHEDGKHGKAIWISCTPLLGSDDRIGVWMCVVVEKSKIIGLSNKASAFEPEDDQTVESIEERSKPATPPEKRADRPWKIEMPPNTMVLEDPTQKPNELRAKDIPIKPVRIDSKTVIKAVTEQLPETPTGRGGNGKLETPNGNGDLTSRKESASTGQQKSSSDHADELSNQIEGQQTDTADKEVSSQVKAYTESLENSKSHSVEIPSHEMNDAESEELQPDEYVTTRSTVPSIKPQSRILIEEDNDVFTDSQEATYEKGSAGRSPSTSHVWSPASEIPPSIPSDAQFSDGDELSRVDTATPSRNSMHSQNQHVNPERENPTACEADERNQSAESIVKQTSPLPPTTQTKPQSPDDVQEQEEAQDQYQEEDETLVGQSQTDYHDDSRPTTAVDTSNTRMDYLRAGGGRWQQGRNPRRLDLTKGNAHIATAHGNEDDWFSDVDCARSPYSVD